MLEKRNWQWSNDPTLNKVEFEKLEKDGLDVISTILDKYAKEGYNSIEETDFNRFKWGGVYH
jgi:ferredoxin-nitrite reductase